ncbi:hypothetical protein DFP72DRAFT_902766 [Ephemerocybe angulata]|uniref:F-box domain-containing protein n=1 Tax=Ephemerocybe angulata TaxID=980116 RepID=A0A8H6HUA4_9AGAR|nr:hypothetical protein DFP72DRAFT_902766 [Tulosesus angulatus]
MNRCLLIHEILCAICDNLEDSELVSAALTTKAFLEPALNSLWRELDSFRPIVSCLPPMDDIWVVKEGPSSFTGGQPTQILYPRRIIVPKDLERYISFYARRVRFYDLRGLYDDDMYLSIEALQALQFATDGKHGALAPFIQSFSWPSPLSFKTVLGEDSARLLSSYMPLFLGDSMTSLVLDATPQIPAHARSLELAFDRYPRLKGLTILRGPHVQMDTHFIEGSLVSRAWEFLQTLQLPFVSVAIMQHLANLPSLASLSLHDFRRMDNFDFPYCTPQEMEDRLKEKPFGKVFTSLKSLSVTGTTVERVIGVLQCIPPRDNIIEKVRCYCRFGSDPSFPLEQQLINVAAMHCNPLTLSHLILSDLYHRRSMEVGGLLEMDLDEELDISSLFKFINIQQLALRLHNPISVTPNEISQITISFPGITKLELCGDHPSFHPPQINHSHFLILLRGCPSLKDLALVFDLSRVREEKAPVVPIANALKILNVGDSPIYSPTKVVSFLKAHTPHLMSLQSACDSESIPKIFSRRWQVAEEMWQVFLESQ